MEEADFLCKRIAIIDYGKFVAMDTSSNLKDILGGDVISLELDGNKSALMEQIKGFRWVKTVSEDDRYLNLTTEKGERMIPKLIKLAHENSVEVTSVHLHKPSLEDVFLHFTGRRIRDQEVSQNERKLERHRQRMRRRRR